MPPIAPTHCDSALKRAETAWQKSRDEEAETILIAARHGALIAGATEKVAHAEVAMAHFALVLDDDLRASRHLSAAHPLLAAEDEQWNASFQVAQSILGRRASPPADRALLPDSGNLAKLGHLDLATRVELENSAWCRSFGKLSESKFHGLAALDFAKNSSPCRAAALAELAELAIAEERMVDAHAMLQEASELYDSLGMQRDKGRILVIDALQVAGHLQNDEPAVRWLSRAQAALGALASWRDRANCRAGFRKFGQRMQDRVVGPDIAARFDAFENASAQMRSTIASAIDHADRSLGIAQNQARLVPESAKGISDCRISVLSILEKTEPNLKQIHGLGRELVDLVEAAAVERNRMSSLLTVLAQIDAVVDIGELGQTAANLGAALLDTDQLVIVRKRSSGKLEAVGRHAPGDVESQLWRSAVEASLATPSSERALTTPTSRSEERPRGPVMVIPIRSSGLTGGLYADKLKRHGQFRERDHQLAKLLSDYFALAYSRLSALNAKRAAFEQLATTVDTIRDGVLAVDHSGLITHINTAAARMLGVDPAKILGEHIRRNASLTALADILESTPRVDGKLVRLRHGSFIVTARPTKQHGNIAGIVATLVELDRAQRIAQRVSAARPRYTFQDVIGESPSLLSALHVARQAAAVDASVLITGESGTGKEVIAQAIHTAGSRETQEFVGVNCAAVPRELLEAELFGYDRGAFTGAKAEGNLGKFEQAAQGTLLLDEIGDMPLDMQAKLLRVLQEKIVVRLGGAAEHRVNTRVIATTHRDLDAQVRDGTFRLDLLYRLRVLHVHLPPLRERAQDIVELSKTFLARVAEQQGKAVRNFSPEVIDNLLAYSWPGNVRELANVIEREVSLLPSDSTSLDTLQVSLQLVQSPSPKSELSVADDREIESMAEVERRTFLHALERCKGHVPRASQALGVSKVTFYAKLRQWGLHPKDIVENALKNGGVFTNRPPMRG